MVSSLTRRFAEATTDYRRLLDSVAFSLAEAIEDSCVLFLAEGETLSVAALHAADPKALALLREGYLGRRLRVSEQPGLRRVLTSGQPLLVPRLADTADTNPERQRWEKALGLHSVLVVALEVQGRSIGLLSLGRFRPESPPFHNGDVDLAQGLADHVALAIENARLFAEATEARDALQRADEMRRKFVEESPHPRYVVDAETFEILQVNQAALDLYGYTREEFLQLHLDDLRHPDDVPRLKGMLRDAGDGHMSTLAKHRRKDGSIIYIDGASQLSTFEGRPARFGVLSDQTQRVRAERERDEIERRLQRTLDDMKEGYTIMGRDLRYLYVNRASAEQTHLTREQLIGRTPSELYPDFDGSPIDVALRRALETGEPLHLETEVAYADGQLGFFDLRIQPVPEGLVVLSIDQSERHRAEQRRDSLEEQLRQSQKMEAVGRLAGGIAHDFNNVLSVILGYTEDLLRSLPPGEVRQDLVEIHTAGTRAATLTRQLLMFSRQQVMEPKVLDLNTVITDMDRMVARALGESIELVALLDKELGHIRADRSSIEQVIMNLVVNARDAMPSGGRLTIETTNVFADEDFVRQHLGTESGPYVCLSVTDTGAGMDAATRARVFEPFFSTKPREQGTGLGLSTVFGIVQRSGGGIWVYSEPGRGSSFKVYLPRVDAAVDDGYKSEPPTGVQGTETILLVEDEQAIRTVARRILERRGYTVLSPTTAYEAIGLAQSHEGPINLLLTDVVMPGINGPELAQRLSSTRPGLKVLYMSGYTDGTIASHQLLEQGTSFVQKPFSAETLARLVRAALDAPSPP